MNLERIIDFYQTLTPESIEHLPDPSGASAGQQPEQGFAPFVGFLRVGVGVFLLGGLHGIGFGQQTCAV